MNRKEFTFNENLFKFSSSEFGDKLFENIPIHKKIDFANLYEAHFRMCLLSHCISDEDFILSLHSIKSIFLNLSCDWRVRPLIKPLNLNKIRSISIGDFNKDKNLNYVQVLNKRQRFIANSLRSLTEKSKDKVNFTGGICEFNNSLLVEIEVK